MTREIKFKVWDNWNKKFLDFGEVDIWDLIFAEPKLIEEIYADGMANECLEFLQFTGLLDKNGKEIYEGDIVKAINGGEAEVYEVSYQLESGYPAFDFNGWEGECNGLCEAVNCPDIECEVIGNIYDNK